MLIPWRKMWDFVAALCEEPDFPGFVRQAVSALPSLLPCEHAYAIFVAQPPMSEKEQPSLISVPQETTVGPAYVGRYYFLDPIPHSSIPDDPYYSMDFRQRTLGRSEFVVDFVRKIWRIHQAAGVRMYDPSSAEHMALGFSRMGGTRIDDAAERLLLALHPHLLNLFTLHRRLETLSPGHYFAAELARDCRLLSKREAEIASLLCKRLRVPEISTLLLISPRTVERHVEHIYEKLGVRNRRELTLALLGRNQFP